MPRWRRGGVVISGALLAARRGRAPSRSNTPSARAPRQVRAGDGCYHGTDGGRFCGLLELGAWLGLGLGLGLGSGLGLGLGLGRLLQLRACSS